MNGKWRNVATWVNKSCENFGSEDKIEKGRSYKRNWFWDSVFGLVLFGALLWLWRGRYLSMFKCWEEASEYMTREIKAKVFYWYRVYIYFFQSCHCLITLAIVYTKYTQNLDKTIFHISQIPICFHHCRDLIFFIFSKYSHKISEKCSHSICTIIIHT